MSGLPERFQPDGSPTYRELLFASRTGGMDEGGIGEVLRVSREARISLAGGLPEILPEVGDLIEKLNREARETWPDASLLQYEGTAGFPPLRERAVSYLHCTLGVFVDSPDEVLVTEGSQDALNLIGLTLIEPGDVVAITVPTYVGALQAFRPYGPRYTIVASDEQGMVPESLRETLRLNRIKLIYEVPTFGNPSGRTISPSRRDEIAEIIDSHNRAAELQGRHITIWVEDDPYSRLRYSGDDSFPIQSRIPKDSVFITTFSKVLAPGIRTGLVVAPAWVLKMLNGAKEGANLCGSNRNQAVIAKYLEGMHVQDHLTKVIASNKPRRDAMLHALEAYFPETWSWTKPDGGMFIWAWGPEGVDTRVIFKRALERGVAFVPGDLFHPEPGISSAMRLNFSFADEVKINEGIAILGKLLAEST
jgi:2-aminoadipate transaminase